MIKFAFLTLLAVLAWAAPAEAQQSGTANQVMATPCAATGRVGLRSLCTADLPATMTPTTLTTTQEADTPVALSGCNGSTATIDLSSGTSFACTVSAGAVTFAVSNLVASKTNSFILRLTNGGSRTTTFMSNTKWPGGKPTFTSSGIDVVVCYSDDGTNWWCSANLSYQ